MFKFGFAIEENDIKTTEESLHDSKNNEEIIWFPCKEIEWNIENLGQKQIKSFCSFICDRHVIKHVPYSDALHTALNSESENIKTAEAQHSDLIPGKYEGGLKLWECTRDVADYLEHKANLDFKDKRVLDLGCGAGILGIYALLEGASVVFQDYNLEVLELLTKPNILLNVSGLDENKVKLYSGDWGAFLNFFTSKNKDYLFDVILTAETIYNPSNYGKLHDVLSCLLAPGGICYLGGKTIYFGVGGSIHGFMEFINQKGKLVAETCWSTSKGVAREILKIRHSV